MDDDNWQKRSNKKLFKYLLFKRIKSIFFIMKNFIFEMKKFCRTTQIKRIKIKLSFVVTLPTVFIFVLVLVFIFCWFLLDLFQVSTFVGIKSCFMFAFAFLPLSLCILVFWGKRNIFFAEFSLKIPKLVWRWLSKA